MPTDRSYLICAHCRNPQREAHAYIYGGAAICEACLAVCLDKIQQEVRVNPPGPWEPDSVRMTNSIAHLVSNASSDLDAAMLLESEGHFHLAIMAARESARFALAALQVAHGASSVVDMHAFVAVVASRDDVLRRLDDEGLTQSVTRPPWQVVGDAAISGAAIRTAERMVAYVRRVLGAA